MNALETFAHWIADYSRNHSEIAVTRARAAVLDTLGCMLAGAGDPVAENVRRTVAQWGDGGCTLVGADRRAPAPWAVLANGTAAHALDFDDCEDMGASHPSAVLVPACIPARNAEILMYPRPEDPMQARFSLPYCTTVAVLHGAVTVADFTPDAVARPEVRAWLPNVTLETHPIHGRSSDLACLEPSIVILHLTGGGERRIEVMHPRGTPARPLKEAEMSGRFRSCAVGVLGAEAAEGAEAAVADLESLADIRDLLRHFQAAPN